MIRRRHKRHPLREDRGVALFVVIGYLAAMTIMATAFMTAWHRSMGQQRLHENETGAYYLAEAGIQSALAVLAARPGEYSGEDATALGEGRFTVQVEKGVAPGVYEIVSTGEITADGYILFRTRIQARARFKDGALDFLRTSTVSARGALERIDP